MSFSINRVTFGGYLGDDPKITELSEGGRVANFSVAATDKWTDKDSQEKRERTEWMRVTVFSDPLINLIEKSLHKGSRVMVDGALQTRKWKDRDGHDRQSTEIVLRPFNGTLTLLDALASAPERPKPAPDQTARRNPPPRARAG